MTELKLKSTVEETAEQLRIYLEGIENYRKLDDYLIDDECGGFIRTLLYQDSLLGSKPGILTVTLDNLMGYTRLHALCRMPKGGSEMEYTLREGLHDFTL